MSKEITLTESQQRVLDKLKAFMASNNRVFILKGYAGTGKTTLMRFFIRHLTETNRSFVLLAPTGRAAKVLSDVALDDRFEGQGVRQGKTIHGLIYSYKGFNREVSEEEFSNGNAKGQLSLCFEPVKSQFDDESESRLYIVDEASMISDEAVKNATQAVFGSGKLLSELLDFDSRPTSKFLFVGDPCQLPPVGSDVSPALDEFYFVPQAQSATLTEIMRQTDGNDLIRVSKQIRSMESSAPDDQSVYGGRNHWTKLPLRHSSNIVLHPTLPDMVSHYEDSVRRMGYNHGIFICRGNKNNSEISAQVRKSLGYGGTIPECGELLMVIQNNMPTGLVNGDMVVVEYVNPNIKQRAGLTFVEVHVKEMVNEKTFSVLLLVDTLWSVQLNLTSVQQTDLFIDFFVRMKRMDVPQNSDAFNEQLRRDPYLNALRCTYGYAVTCHKAQGGEWDEVYIDLPRNIGLNPTKQTFRWLYTAVTRAKKTLHLVDDGLYLQ